MPEAGIAEILSHIQDRQDRHALGELLKKYEVLRLRLLVKPPGLESDQAAIKKLQEQLAGWGSWYKANEKFIRSVYANNKELREKVSRLEDKMRELLLRWNPPTNRKLFQGAAGLRTSRRSRKPSS